MSSRHPRIDERHQQVITWIRAGRVAYRNAGLPLPPDDARAEWARSRERAKKAPDHLRVELSEAERLIESWAEVVSYSCQLHRDDLLVAVQCADQIRDILHLAGRVELLKNARDSIGMWGGLPEDYRDAG